MPNININLNKDKTEATVVVECDPRVKSKDPKQWYGTYEVKKILLSEHPKLEIEKVIQDATATNYNEQSRIGEWVFALKAPPKQTPAQRKTTRKRTTKKATENLTKEIGE